MMGISPCRLLCFVMLRQKWASVEEYQHLRSRVMDYFLPPTFPCPHQIHLMSFM